MTQQGNKMLLSDFTPDNTSLNPFKRGQISLHLLKVKNLSDQAEFSVKSGYLREAVFCYDHMVKELQGLANEFGYELKPKGV